MARAKSGKRTAWKEAARAIRAKQGEWGYSRLWVARRDPRIWGTTGRKNGTILGGVDPYMRTGQEKKPVQGKLLQGIVNLVLGGDGQNPQWEV